MTTSAGTAGSGVVTYEPSYQAFGATDLVDVTYPTTQVVVEVASPVRAQRTEVERTSNGLRRSSGTTSLATKP